MIAEQWNAKRSKDGFNNDKRLAGGRVSAEGRTLSPAPAISPRKMYDYMMKEVKREVEGLGRPILLSIIVPVYNIMNICPGVDSIADRPTAT